MEYFRKKGLYVLHLNVNSHLLKIDEILFHCKSNASLIRISESKLDSSILNSEVDVVSYDIKRMDR